MKSKKIQKKLVHIRFMDDMGNMNKKNVDYIAGNDAEQFAEKLFDEFSNEEIRVYLKMLVNAYTGSSNEAFIYLLSYFGRLYGLEMKQEGICILWQLIDTVYFKEYFDTWFAKLYYAVACMKDSTDNY